MTKTAKTRVRPLQILFFRNRKHVKYLLIDTYNLFERERSFISDPKQKQQFELGLKGKSSAIKMHFEALLSTYTHYLL